MYERKNLMWDGKQLRLYRGRLLVGIEPDRPGLTCGASAYPTDISAKW